MGIGNFGLTELFIIVVLVLIFFGPKEMPEIARTLARFLRDVRRNVNEIVREFEELDRSGDGGGGSARRGRDGSAGSGARAGDRVLPPDAREGPAPDGEGRAGTGEGAAGAGGRSADAPGDSGGDAGGPAGSGEEPSREGSGSP